jgi:hypothetical protein
VIVGEAVKSSVLEKLADSVKKSSDSEIPLLSDGSFVPVNGSDTAGSTVLEKAADREKVDDPLK